MVTATDPLAAHASRAGDVFDRPAPRRTYNVEEAAKVLGISRSLAYDEARRGTLPGLIRIGNRFLVSKDAIDRLLAGEAA